MSFSIRVGFLLAILSVIIGAGIYQQTHAASAGPVIFHVKPAEIVYRHSFEFKKNPIMFRPSLYLTPYLPSANKTPSFFKENKLKEDETVKDDITLNSAMSLFIFPEAQSSLFPKSLLLSEHGFVLLKNKPFAVHYTFTDKTSSSIVRFPPMTLVDYFASLVRSPDVNFLPQKKRIQKNGIDYLGIFNKGSLGSSNTGLKFRDDFFQPSELFSSSLNALSLKQDAFMLPVLSTNRLTTAISPSPLPLTQSVSVQSAALIGDIGHTQLIFRLSQPSLYTVSTDKSQQILTLEIENINPDISSIPPLDVRGKAIQNIVFNVTPANQLAVTLTLMPQVELQGLRFVEDSLVVDVGMASQIPYVGTPNNQNARSDSNIPVQPLIKTFVPLTPTELATQNYDEAVDLLNQGNAQGARDILQMLVVQHPDYLKGRVLLANLLLQQNEAKQALDVLVKISDQPNIQDDPTYYNLLAEAYRQTNQNKSAIKIYRLLLTLDPSQATWWIGLGMCFEALNQNDAAIEAYQKAKATENLTPVLQEFVAGKLGTSQ